MAPYAVSHSFGLHTPALIDAFAAEKVKYCHVWRSRSVDFIVVLNCLDVCERVCLWCSWRA